MRKEHIERYEWEHPIWAEKGIPDPVPWLDYDLSIIKANLGANKMDFLTVNEGREGAGKSNMSLYQATYVRGQNYSLDYVYYEPRVFYEELPDIPKHSVVIIDEGGNMAYKRKWNSEDNINLNIILMVCRYKELYIILNIPDVFKLDSDVRGSRISNLFRTFYNLNEKTKMFDRGIFKAYSAEKVGVIRKDIMTGRKIYPKEDYQDHLPSVEFINPPLWAAYEPMGNTRKGKIISDIAKSYQKRDKKHGKEENNN